MRHPQRPAAVAHARRQRVLGVTSLIGVLGLYAAILVAPALISAVTDVGVLAALRTTVLVVALIHGLLAVALFR